MHDVFISYSTKERHQACAIRSFLQDNGISCWMAPESIPTGSNYTKEIPVAIRNCKIFLLILSEHAQQSPWVLRELDGAVNNGKYILPYLLDEAPMADEFQFLLTGCQWHPSWMEDALPRLAERILALLPPKEVVQEEPPVVQAEPDPEPAVPVAPVTPITPPVASSPILCPACGSHKTEPLTKGRHSYSGGESARFALAVLAGLAAYPLIYFFVELLMESFGICVAYRYTYIMDTFTDLGYTIISLVSLAGSVGVGLLCLRYIRRWIRMSRTKKCFRSNGMICRDCCKKFRISIPVMIRFPWEPQETPKSMPPDTAVVRCPSCGTYGVTPRKGGEGSWDSKEKWTFLPAWLAGVASVPFMALLVNDLIQFIPFFILSKYGRNVTLTSLGTFVAMICTLAGAYGIVRLVRIPLKEIIRRKRVRNHVKACGFRCPKCDIRFRVTIPATRRFPWEQETGANTHLRQGK